MLGPSNPTFGFAPGPAPAVASAIVPERLSRDEVTHVAELARLRLSEDELDRFTGQLGSILDHAADIEAAETKSGVGVGQDR